MNVRFWTKTRQPGCDGAVKPVSVNMQKNVEKFEKQF